MNASRCLSCLVLCLVAGCGLTLAPLNVAAQTAAVQQAPFDQTHAAWSEILKACVHDGGFDYAKLKADRTRFDAYLAALHAVTPQDLATWTNEQRFAFWINCYNAHCIQKVVDNYPLVSIKKLSGAFGLKSVFDQDFIPMRAHDPFGKDGELSLNDIEHEILRKKFKDARVHAAINCASKSCPPLRNDAFTADKLSAQLDEQMKSFVADPARNRIDPAKKELAVSEIFKWFAEDFERDAKSVPEFLARFAPADKTDFVRGAKPSYLDYDWDLNDVPKK